jgi:structure-specific endonuclease subunit SLX1
MRGEKEIAALFKPKRGKKNAGSVDEVVDSEDELDEPDEDALDIVFEMQENQWQELSESSQDEAQKPAQTSKIPLSQKHASFKRPLRETSDLEPVIDDSDWNDAEIIT